MSCAGIAGLDPFAVVLRDDIFQGRRYLADVGPIVLIPIAREHLQVHLDSRMHIPNQIDYVIAVGLRSDGAAGKAELGTHVLHDVEANANRLDGGLRTEWVREQRGVLLCRVLCLGLTLARRPAAADVLHGALTVVDKTVVERLEQCRACSMVDDDVKEFHIALSKCLLRNVGVVAREGLEAVAALLS